MFSDYALSPLILQWLIWPVVRPLFWFFGRFQVHGLDNLKNLPSGAIFASNHTGELDAILIPAALPFFSKFRPFFYTSREQSFYKTSGWRQLFYGGFLFKLLGAYPLLPGKQNYELSLATHIRLAKLNRSVIIFPEGKAGHGEIMGEGKGGVAYIAHAANKPIIPIAIYGTYDLQKKEFYGKKKQLIIVFGKPLYGKELFAGKTPVISDDQNDFKNASQIVMNKIKGMYDKISLEYKKENGVIKNDMLVRT